MKKDCGALRIGQRRYFFEGRHVVCCIWNGKEWVECTIEPRDVTVIGNKWNNPELLEGKG